MYELSPEAQKAVENARARDTLWRPSLARTEHKLILRHATNNRRGQRQQTARVMLEELGWSWNAKKCWFHADLSPENLRAVLATWTNVGWLHLDLSEGVLTYQAQLRDEALSVERTRGRSKLFKS